MISTQHLDAKALWIVSRFEEAAMGIEDIAWASMWPSEDLRASSALATRSTVCLWLRSVGREAWY